TLTLATSGTIVALPVAEMLIVWVAGSVVLVCGAAVDGVTWTVNAATATNAAPSAAAAADARDRGIRPPAIGFAAEEGRRCTGDGAPAWCVPALSGWPCLLPIRPRVATAASALAARPGPSRRSSRQPSARRL